MSTLATPQRSLSFWHTMWPTAGRVVVAVHVGALVFFVIWFRTWQLATVPGLNGDEAWYGAQAERLLAGEAFAWRTPTGSLLNPFFFLPQVAVHWLGEPSVVRLRMPALLSGLMALALHAVLARWRWDTQTAIYSTLLLAVLPINLAYSRFAWDASQTVLATTIFIHCALALTGTSGSILPYSTKESSLRAVAAWPSNALSCGQRSRELSCKIAMLGLLAFLSALWVHPTNIFLLPIAVGAAIANVAGRGRLPQFRTALATPHGRVTAIGLASVALLVAWIARRFVYVACVRPWYPEQWWLFARRLVELLSGVTVYRFVPGSIEAESGPLGNSAWMLNLCVVTGLVLVGRAWYRHRHQLTASDWALGVGTVTSVLAFFLVAGPEAIEAHYERYGMCLVVPLCLVASRAIAWNTTPRSAGRVRWRIATWASAWLLLGSFYGFYMRPFCTTGGDSHFAFRTSPAGDPKQLALEGLSALAGNAESPLWIVAEDWWTEWPARYLLARKAGIRVLSVGEAHAQAENLTAAQRAGRVRWIGLAQADSEIAMAVLNRPPLAPSPGRGEQVLPDRGGRPCVVVRDR